ESVAAVASQADGARTILVREDRHGRTACGGRRQRKGTGSGQTQASPLLTALAWCRIPRAREVNTDALGRKPSVARNAEPVQDHVGTRREGEVAVVGDRDVLVDPGGDRRAALAH